MLNVRLKIYEKIFIRFDTIKFQNQTMIWESIYDKITGKSASVVEFYDQVVGRESQAAISKL